MSRGLLSGLTKAEKSPYAGWKTTSFVEREPLPENDEVCLLDDGQGTSTQSDSRKCLSDGLRNPWEFCAKKSQYQIPKKPSGSPDDNDKKGQQWFDSSFNEEVEGWHGNCQARSHNQKQRNTANYANKQKAKDFEEGIGYRIHRQGVLTPKSRWKHADPPGTLSHGRRTNETPSARESSSYQVTNARVSEKCNGHVSGDTTKSHIQRNCSSLVEEKRQNRSVLDQIMTGKSVRICAYSDSDDTGSDSNFRNKSRLSVAQGTPSSSKDLLSDDNYEDCFVDCYCKNCSKLLQDKKCPNCDKDIFPSQAATPRKSLSAERFYSSDVRQPKVQKTYGNNRSRGNPKLLETGSLAAKMSDANKRMKEDETSQTSATVKKRKNQGKSNSEDSDSEQRPQVKKKRSGRQTKLAVPKKVDVITLSDEEENIEAMTELIVEKSKSPTNKEPASSSVTVIPETPVSQEKVAKQSVVESNSENSPEMAGKRKTSPSKEEPNIKKKSGHGYSRDDLEVEIMLGQDVHIGTLACTATKPLKITCHNDEIKLDVDYGNKNCLLTISGNDLASFKINTTSNPGVIVLGVTPGYALKLTQRIPTKGTFLNPGSAVARERNIVLEVSEHVKRETIADLMEWVTDKLSKEFAELSVKEVERIMSYKASASTSGEQNQSSDEVTKSPPMTTRSRTYNTRTNSSKQPAMAPQKLVIYPPPPQPGGITITTEDIACLAPDEFLNDVIIDFYLKFVFYEKLKAEDRARTHILSSFFYKRLTQRNNSNSDSFTSTPDRMHSQVRTWTKNVDIFEKDFVIVPINESSHWYLAVICFAGQQNATCVNEINDEDDEKDSKKTLQQNEATVDTETGTEQESGSDDDDEFEFSPLATVRKKPTKRTSRKGLSKQIIKSQPCILVFDSLGGSRTRCMLNLRNYLRCEWRERKKQPETRIFDKETIKGSHPKVPQQDNFCDCGVYVLQYMESFFEDPITDFSLPIKKPDWFSSIAQKRTEIQRLVYHLKASAEIDDT